ncbi:MAG: rubrerythrin family protein [Halovenus sp.]
MDEADFVERVQESNATELKRLGSEKALVATTAASLDRETVLEQAAATQARTVATLQQWADNEPNDTASAAFATAAEQEQDHYDRICDLGAVEVTDPPADALHTHLRDLDDTVERVGAGLVARPLVASRTLLQVINFFVNEADTTAADLFREIRTETDEQVETGASVLAGICESDDWERAERAAEEAVEVAYTEYADTLDRMGLDPKPVC